MKKKFIRWLVVSVVIMLVQPWVTVTFVKGDAGMAVCFLFFYVINPIYSIVIGAVAGKDRKRLWSLPVISAVLFLCGTWMFFDIGEMLFIIYAAVYLVLGVVASLLF